MKYKEHKSLDLTAISEEILKYWEKHDIFQKSIRTREGQPPFVFYEGPPSANGMPGIHHVLGRTIKDIFCRYKTLQGFKVERKGGWDTHGLPVELQVEKRLNIRKEDIGEKISVADYNAECRKDVMKFKGVWDDLTRKIGFWLDLDNPYLTYEPDYIESIWWLLKQLFDKGLLYRGYTIQPYSPAAGTGLSSHELNQPGCYREVKDVTVVAQFKVIGQENTYFLAWTTTPWTLPSNAALAVGKNIDYVKIKTYNRYTHQPVELILGKDSVGKYFNPEGAELDFDSYDEGQKIIPYRVTGEMKGSDLEGMHYEQLLPYVQPEGDAFRVVTGDFVSTEEGTGIVHIAPTFGADDYLVAKQKDIPAITVTDPKNPLKQIPLVDRTGKFVEQVADFAGRYVKDYTDEDGYTDVNIDIVVKLKQENKAFLVEKYVHNYPHCWRTDKPILYYPLESWFVKTTAYRDKLIEKNNQINWQPESTGKGRFGNWLENLVDWNLSRSRYWGTPLNVWLTEDGSEMKCIGSMDELRAEVQKAIEAGFAQKPIADDFDPHRPFVDEVVLVSDNGMEMRRVPDVIDVWFDSGAMPYAQLHYPFENQDVLQSQFPADFIAEGVDQTRGWFFTLHVLGVLLFDSEAYRNVVANGLVLDKNGEKMSKRKGNVVDPFMTIEKYGADATRWYMVHNSQPWDNLKFDLEGVDESRKKFFGTLFNVYSFFALYANIDGFEQHPPAPPQESGVLRTLEGGVQLQDRPELDRWIISRLHSLIQEVTTSFDNYEPTRAARAIQDFVLDHLSNWYVRLARRRFWKGEMTADKKAAYETLQECLVAVSQLMSPIAPFFSDWLYKNLTDHIREKAQPKDALQYESVHLTLLPKARAEWMDPVLEKQMELAQEISSLTLSLRKQQKIRVRQPLNRIIIPVLNPENRSHIERVKDLILNEVNVKDLEFIDDTSGIIVKKLKADFKKLGPKFGKQMKAVQQALQELSQKEIAQLEVEGSISLAIEGDTAVVRLDEVEILSDEMPGWLIATSGGLTVALDVTLTPELKNEGLSRELVNRIQNLRKEKDFDVTDHIKIEIKQQEPLAQAVKQYNSYICAETLADSLVLTDSSNGSGFDTVQVEDLNVLIKLKKAKNVRTE
ncbi:MAG: isoleucine--tRNA ligase [Bacteroidia bacterium]